MGTIRASAAARHSTTLRDTPFKASAPIPIPNLRRITDPPPRSPTRCHDTSSDLIFEMSPHVTHENPLTQLREPPNVNPTTTHYARKPLTFSTRYGQPKSTAVERRPYWEEPFLYSVPRLPPRAPLQHSRTQSACLSRPASIGDEENQSTAAASSYPSSSSSSNSLSHKTKPIAGDPTVAHPVEDSSVHVLTTAFQQSFSSATSYSQSCRSSLSPHVQFKESLSPPVSVRGWDTPPLSMHTSPLCHKRSMTKSSAISGVIRTSAAEPVVSFAQAELKHSPSSGVITRVVKVTRTTPHTTLRAKSPYPAARGRRGSVLRNTSVKVSDDDLVNTLEKSQASGNFGLEKFPP